MRRTIFGALFGALALAQNAQAQDWPTRPVTMVVPFAAGGAVDVVARIVAGPLGEHLGQQVIVENIGGAGGMNGAARVAKAAPDGYTFGLGSAGTHAQNQTLYKKPLYDAATDFAPVGLIVEQPLLLVARKDFPAGDLKEFVAYAKANAAAMKYGSAGTGSATHLGCVLFNSATGVAATHIPYRGGGPSMQDLIAGRLDYACNLIPTVLPQIEGKTVKAIAMLSRNRSPAAPDLATAHEQGLLDFDVYSWVALFLPKGTPDAIIRKLNAASIAAMNTPAVQERLRSVGANAAAPERRSPDYLARFVREEIAKWAAPIKASGISVD